MSPQCDWWTPNWPAGSCKKHQHIIKAHATKLSHASYLCGFHHCLLQHITTYIHATLQQWVNPALRWCHLLLPTPHCHQPPLPQHTHSCSLTGHQPAAAAAAVRGSTTQRTCVPAHAPTGRSRCCRAAAPGTPAAHVLACAAPATHCMACSMHQLASSLHGRLT